MLKKILIPIASFLLMLGMPFAVLAQSEDTPVLDTSYDYQYDWSAFENEYSALTDAEAAALGGAALFGTAFAVIMAIVSSVAGLAMYIYMSLALMTIANKLGVENGWFAWVPILNLILMAKLGDVNPWLLLLFLIPGVNAIFMLYFAVAVFMKICEKRGLDKYIGLLILLPVANIVLPGYLAWAKLQSKA